MDNELVVTRGQEVGEEGRGRWSKGGQIQGDGEVVKEIKYMAAERNWTLGGNHTIEYIDVKL